MNINEENIKVANLIKEELNKVSYNTIRDENRIEPFLEKFKELWLKYPDLRFGQLFSFLEGKFRRDTFYIEEDEWLKVIQNEIDK